MFVLEDAKHGIYGFRIASAGGVEELDSDTARMMRMLAEDGSTQLAAIDTDERGALLLSLAVSLTRATYHHRRFQLLVQDAENRRRQVGAVLSADMCALEIVYEAGATLAAARSGVDEVLHIAARRAGVPHEEATRKWEAAKVTGATLAALFDVEEVRELRSRGAWYSELNEYRNALVHRGMRENLGAYFPVGCRVPSADDPTRNVMLIPDRASLVGRSKPWQWTYRDGLRLEDLERRSFDGFKQYLDAVGRAWGGHHPPPGTLAPDRRPNMLVIAPSPAIIAGGGNLYVPLFSEVPLANAFRDAVGYASNGKHSLTEVLPTRVEMYAGGPGYLLRLPAGDELAMALNETGTSSTGEVILTLNPETSDGKLVPGLEVERAPLEELLRENGPSTLGRLLLIPPLPERLYIWWQR